jgi:hypothetical protein
VIQWGGLIPREIGLGTSMWLSSKGNMALQFDLRKVEANISACHSVPP